MSATTLPGGKYPYGICQIVKNGGVRGCLLVEVWVVWDLSEFDVLLPNRGRYWVTLCAEVKVASPATPMIYILCFVLTQVASKAHFVANKHIVLVATLGSVGIGMNGCGGLEGIGEGMYRWIVSLERGFGFCYST